MNDKIRSPKQKRSIETKKSIIDAAITLFSEKGFHSTNSKEISKRAGVATGSFYAYFKDKKSLLIEVLNKNIEHTLERVSKNLENLIKNLSDNREKIKIIIEKVFEGHDFLTDFYREIIALKYTDEDIRKIRLYEEELSIKAILEIMNAFFDNIKAKNLKLAAYLIYMSIEESVRAVKIFKTIKEEKALIEELTDMIYKYLFS